MLQAQVPSAEDPDVIDYQIFWRIFKKFNPRHSLYKTFVDEQTKGDCRQTAFL